MSASQVAEMMRLVNGYQISQSIHVAAALGIADYLADGPRTIDDLASVTGAHAPTLYRLMRALASVGVFLENETRTFSLTELGSCLQSNSPTPVAPWAIFVGRPYMWEAWAHLMHSVRTGENAFRHVHGMSNFEYRLLRPDEQSIFDQAMSGGSRGLSSAIMQACDFSRFRTLVDVGGGEGALLADILSAYPALRGILFDQKSVIARSGPILERGGLRDRCELVGGSFFESIPRGGDAYILKFILHDWDDATCLDILTACRRAMSADAILLVLERLIGPPNEGADAKFADLNMLVEPGGQERTAEEFGNLFGAAGFKLTRVVPTGTRINLIEGVLV